MKDNKNNKAKIYMIFSLVVLVIVVIVSGTYAYYVWTTSDSDTTKIVAGIGAATVTFDGGSDISANLRPVSDKSKGIVKNINVKADTTGLVFNMYLDITSIDTGLKDESFRYELYKGDTKVKEGNFSDSYLTSNTVTCTKNNTNHIVLLTNESISTSKTLYTLYIWIDGENYTNPNTMMNKTFSFKLHADGEGAVLKTPPTAAETITELYTNAEKVTVTNNSIDYYIAPSVSLMNDRLGGTTEDLDGGNIRYYGASPDNYIYFNCEIYPDINCELWRIIGVFDGKLKLIKNEKLNGFLPWDYDKNDDGTSTTSDNNWHTSTLQKLLNEKYYNGEDVVNYYYNSIQYTTLDMSSIGIKNVDTRNKIEKATWYLGGYNDGTVFSNQIYEYERGTNKCEECIYDTTWLGKIALPYPSDYGYAASFDNLCTLELNKYNDTKCINNNWMYSIISSGSRMNNGNFGWLLTPNSGSSSLVFSVTSGECDPLYSTSTGLVNGAGFYFGFSVNPTLYLNSDIRIESGDGSSSNPYKLSV